MPRLTGILVVLVALLGVGVVWLATRPLPPVPTEADIRAMVDDALAARVAESPAPTVIDAETINPMIEDYLLGNPSILQEVSAALEREIRTAEAAETKAAIAALETAIYEDDDHVVLGNPEGDVTLVEMFDYNCGYCRQALPDLATLLAEDPNLKVILKEFPILSEGSVAAARIGVLVNQSEADYWAFHQRLFSSRGQVTAETALAAAGALGLNPIELELQMGTPAVTAVIDKSYELARALNISGTPTYIIGDELIPGAIGIEGLRTRIANMRDCGQTDCSQPAGNG